MGPKQTIGPPNTGESPAKFAKMNFYFVIFADNDKPIYEYDDLKADSFKGEDSGRDLHKFIVHAALDMVDELQWSPTVGTSPYLKVVDRYNEWFVSAFITSTGIMSKIFDL